MSKFRSNHTSYLQHTNIQNKAKQIVNTEIQNYQQRKTNTQSSFAITYITKIRGLPVDKQNSAQR